MKRIVFIPLLFLLLVGCAQEDLPPTPPPPGGSVYAGAAIGGVQIPAQLPSWAAPIKHTDITPEVVEYDDSVVVTVEKPAGLNKRFLILEYMYAFNSEVRLWERVNIDKGESGKLLGGFGQVKWAKNKAVFEIPVGEDRFASGPNYVVTYWCIDDGEDAQGNTVWQCNGNKWGLGRFDVKGPGWPDILIEEDIENNRYQRSEMQQVADGTAYTAKYEHLNGVPTDVEVVKLDDVVDFKESLARQLPLIEPKWQKRGQVCGFLQTGTDIVSFSWLSSDWWISVTTESNVPDDAKIGKYGIKYPSDCGLLDDLKQVAAGLPGSCGNNITEAGEQCDMYDDAACPGLCRPDCSCMTGGQPNTGVCGDLIVQQPNSNGKFEECEPPVKRDPITGTVLSGSLCFIKDVRGKILSAGHCGTDCSCKPGLIALPKCGNGVCDANEDHVSCPADCLPPVAKVCTDSDDENYYYKGTVTDNGVKSDDACVDNVQLREQTCEGPKVVDCKFGCANGKCNPAPAPEYCPDAVSVWSHDDKVHGRNIWYSLYWDGVGTWAARSGQVRTGEAASLAILPDGDDNDPDVDSWQGGQCGQAVAVWSHVPSAVVNLRRAVDADIAVAKIAGRAVAAPVASPGVYYSLWDWNAGWTSPQLVAPNGYDPAVAVNPMGVAVAVWVQRDGLYAAEYNPAAGAPPAWSAPVKVYNGADVRLPQIAYNRVLQKWVALWVSGGAAMTAEYKAGVWSAPAKVPGQMGTADTDGLVLPAKRTGIDSQWYGRDTVAAWGVDKDAAMNVWTVGAASPNKIPKLFSPDVDFDFFKDDWHVLARLSIDLGFFDEVDLLKAAIIPQQGPDTDVVDGRPAHTFVRPSNFDVGVWHDTRGKPFFNDIMWSRRDLNGWSTPKKLVTLGLPSFDRNPDIAPLVSEPTSDIPPTDEPPSDEPIPGLGIGWPAPGGGPGPGMGGGGGGNGNGNGGSGNGGGGNGGAGGGIGGGDSGAGGDTGDGAVITPSPGDDTGGIEFPEEEYPTDTAPDSGATSTGEGPTIPDVTLMWVYDAECNKASGCSWSAPTSDARAGDPCYEPGATVAFDDRSVRKISCSRERQDDSGGGYVSTFMQTGSCSSLENCPWANVVANTCPMVRDMYSDGMSERADDGTVCRSWIGADDDGYNPCPCPDNCRIVDNSWRRRLTCVDVAQPKWFKAYEYASAGPCPEGAAMGGLCNPGMIGAVCQAGDEVLKCYGVSSDMPTGVVVGQSVYRPQGYAQYYSGRPESSGIQGLLVVIASLGIVVITLFNILRKE